MTAVHICQCIGGIHQGFSDVGPVTLFLHLWEGAKVDQTGPEHVEGDGRLDEPED